jgi:hypothetical protein
MAHRALRRATGCSMATYKGECFSGAVHIEVTGDPEGMGYCHCRSCRSWSGAPVNAFTLWKPDAVRITAGTQHVGVFQKTPLSQRRYCKNCGGHLMNPTLRTRRAYPSSSDNRADRCLCSHAAIAEVRPWPPHQLRRDGASYARWPAKAEGFRRVGRTTPRIEHPHTRATVPRAAPRYQYSRRKAPIARGTRPAVAARAVEAQRARGYRGRAKSPPKAGLPSVAVLCAIA